MTVRIEGSLAVVDFQSPFDLQRYGVFLQAKKLPESQLAYDWQSDRYTLTTPARFASLLGAGAPTVATLGLPLAPHLFDFQTWTVQLALNAERFACWCDTGLGKTSILLEWSRQVLHRTGGRVLILCPLGLVEQHRAEAQRFYGDALPIERLHSREQLATWCQGPSAALGICNYDKLLPRDGDLESQHAAAFLRHLAGLVLDESSVLKTGGGKLKWALIKSSKGIPYKLSCTATPAPNDAMEYASQAAFLEKLRTEADILWTYFTKTDNGYVVKPHAKQAFYEFMASWSLYMRDPARFGFADILSTLPPPEYHEYRLAITDEQRILRDQLIVHKGGGLFDDDRLGVKERTKLAQAARGFQYEASGKTRGVRRVESAKPRAVAELVEGDVSDGRQVLVWTVFDEESAIIEEYLRGTGIAVGVLHGFMNEDARIDVLDRFRRGDLDCVLSKPQLMGYGLNLQFVRSMVFSGIDDSFERRYQAERRAVRFGQTESVRIHEPYIPELEGMMWGNVARKEQRFLDDVGAQEHWYRQAFADKLPFGVVS